VKLCSCDLVESRDVVPGHFVTLGPKVKSSGLGSRDWSKGFGSRV